ncbi:DMT family transporter [Sedimentibacter sp. MB31-C6]|uniref:DMT family transporter n=1 Tax=Sedimentibacter sp. MB31-C6 TaxID=3109366 RepID=UPI002DDDB431|nr:EamA family transporter [Sedimentibacter sp. MB36-C1]WSI03636.1 EamA family transporter [Sedimentibacter sp. MB36-C1]
MIQSHLGEIYALITAVFWTITAVCFELAGKKIGSLSVNYIRLVIAFVFISLFTTFSRGMFLPVDATIDTWIWLSISGLIGFVVGDLFLFQAYLEIGSRISMLIMALVPPVTALLGFITMKEMISLSGFLGMLVTIIGIFVVVLVKNPENNNFKFSKSIKGLTYAFIGALGQSFGLIFSKIGMGDYDPFAATQIRILSGIIGFTIVFFFWKKWDKLKEAIKTKDVIKYLLIGSLFGPFLGVSFNLLAIQNTTTGISSTITSIVPVLIIPLSIFILKEKVSPKEMIGAIISVIGVSILFII